LIDDESRFRFYDQRIPKSVVDSITFNAWWKAAEREKSGLMESLNMTESDLISAVSHEEEEFPDEWNCPPFTFSLRYHFDPMSADDGVTVSIPALLFREVPQAAFEWLVPGLLLEKITALIRSLPKSKRRAFIPVPNVAKSCQEALKGVDHRESLLSNIALVLNRFSGISIAIEEFNLQELSPHLFMRVEILNEKGEVISIYRQGYEKPPEEQSYLSTGLPLLGSRDSSWEREGVSCWDFGPFPERLSTQFHGTSIALYPAIQDKGSAVDLVLESTLEKAAELSRRGILRLCFIELQKERGECRLQSQEVDGYLSFARQVFGVSERILREDLEMGVVMRVCGEFDSPDAFPRTQEAFERIISSRVQFLEVAKELARQGTFLLTEYVRLTKKIKKLSGQLFLSENLSDLNLQLSELFYAGFISSTPLRYFKRLSVYLKGADIRLERLMNHPAKDQEGRIEFERKRLVLSEKWMIEELRLQAFSTGLAGLK
jgi:ATP-dependent helicase HrpA